MPAIYRLLIAWCTALVLPGEALANWGENWGTMLWGVGSVAVPSIEGWGLGLLVLLLAGSAAFTLRRRRWGLGPVLGLLVLAIPLAVAASSIDDLNLHVFTDGTPAVAGEVNANFDTVQAAVNDNDARIGAAQSTAVAAAAGHTVDTNTQLTPAEVAAAREARRGTLIDATNVQTPGPSGYACAGTVPCP